MSNARHCSCQSPSKRSLARRSPALDERSSWSDRQVAALARLVDRMCRQCGISSSILVPVTMMADRVTKLQPAADPDASVLPVDQLRSHGRHASASCRPLTGTPEQQLCRSVTVPCGRPQVTPGDVLLTRCTAQNRREVRRATSVGCAQREVSTAVSSGDHPCYDLRAGPNPGRHHASDCDGAALPMARLVASSRLDSDLLASSQRPCERSHVSRLASGRLMHRFC